MRYYRVLERFDNARLLRLGKDNILRYTDIFLVGGELYTDRELQKMRAIYFEPYHRGKCVTRDEIFEPIEVSKKKVYWCSGCRFVHDKYINR